MLDETGALAARVPRNLRARPRVDHALCNGCGLCVDFCPFDCLSLVGRRYQALVWLAEPLACVSCADCQRVCIKHAITMQPLDLSLPDPAPPPPAPECYP